MLICVSPGQPPGKTTWSLIEEPRFREKLWAMGTLAQVVELTGWDYTTVRHAKRV